MEEETQSLSQNRWKPTLLSSQGVRPAAVVLWVYVGTASPGQAAQWLEHRPSMGRQGCGLDLQKGTYKNQPANE